MNEMTDIENAKNIYFDVNYSCVLCRGNAVLKSRESGIKYIFELCSDRNSYEGFSAADKIVGKAAAMLYAKMGVKNVYAHVLSKEGRRALEKYGITYSCDIFCDEIINRKGDDICPMEKAVKPADTYEEAYELLCKKFEKIC